LYYAQGQPRTATEVASLVFHHPAMPSDEKEEMLVPFLPVLQAALPPSEYEAALAHGQTLTISAVVNTWVESLNDRPLTGNALGG
ncbi:MAG: hypothetical protein JNL09_08475, partial [Anaerolineales bacterium]|nr:hypothetical protein [Anaerolineales bacterium]